MSFMITQFCRWVHHREGNHCLHNYIQKIIIHAQVISILTSHATFMIIYRLIIVNQFHFHEHQNFQHVMNCSFILFLDVL